MSGTLPVIKAKMGNRDYFVSRMSAGEFAGQMRILFDMVAWGATNLNDLDQHRFDERHVARVVALCPGNTRVRQRLLFI